MVDNYNRMLRCVLSLEKDDSHVDWGATAVPPLS